MGPPWVLSAPDGPHVGPMSPAIRVTMIVNIAPAIESGRNIPLQVADAVLHSLEITDDPAYFANNVILFTDSNDV